MKKNLNFCCSSGSFGFRLMLNSETCGKSYISLLSNSNSNSILMDKDRSCAVCAVRSFNFK
ncbi:MAG: hypothetical protein ACTTIZ_05815 [Treponema sp.]